MTHPSSRSRGLRGSRHAGRSRVLAAALRQAEAVVAERAERSLADSLTDALDPTRLMLAAGLDPDPWQARLLREQPHRALVVTSRQSGKSTATAALAVHRCAYVPGSTVVVVSPTQRQSSEVVGKCRTFLGYLPAEYAQTDGDARTAVEFANGSRLLALPGTTDSVRGYTADLLVVDEAAYLPDAVYAAVRPMLAASGGAFVALSTPAGREGWFPLAWHSDEPWHRTRVTAHEVPRIGPDTLAAERRAMTRTAFAREYLAEFVEDSGSPFTADDVDAAAAGPATPLPPAPVVLGLAERIARRPGA